MRAQPPVPGRLSVAWARARHLLTSLAAVGRARYDLRGCARIGARPRLFGRCHVSGGRGIEIGDRLLMIAGTVRSELSTHEGGRLSIGDHVFLNYGVSISAHSLVEIGDGCQIGQYAIILDCDYHTPEQDGSHGLPAPVILEHGVWLGARVTVLKGVRIGAGSTIAAGSVVTRDIPRGVVAAGVPARVLRRIGSPPRPLRRLRPSAPGPSAA
jgi:acetyltransferase-like isoleucine patch superfamily enzyme